MVYGTTNYDHGAYRIDCTDPAQGWPAWSIPSGRSPWFAFDEVLWFGLVDSGSVSIQNMDDGRWLDLARVDVITATGWVGISAKGIELMSQGSTEARSRRKWRVRRWG